MNRCQRRCAACILPDTYPGITFDERGICNHCRTHREKKPAGEAALQEKLESTREYAAFGLESQTERRTVAYDCMIALSGGRDSSFAAYYAVKELGLKALLYTFDNGFMPEQTTENVKNVAHLLGMDHVTIKSDAVRKNVRHVMSCWVHKPSPAMIGLLCSGCRTGYIRGRVETARKYQIPLIITGSGEPERSFAQRLLSTTQTRRKKLPLIAGLARQVKDNPRYLSSPGFVIRLGSEFFYRFVFKAKRSEKTLSIFRYIGWSEDHILSVIQDKLQWEKPAYSQSSWRADCAINELKNYLYKHTLGFTKHDELLSGMIRRQMITRQEALQRLERDNEISRPFLQNLLQDLGLNLHDVDIALENS